MTCEEAIEYINCGAVPSCMCSGNIKHGGECRGEDAVCDALDLAIEALKKQIQMKPRIEEDMCIEHIFCPVCGAFFGDKSKRIRFLGRQPKYCDCGQAIDWSENND